jgi:hypothetical protein
MTSKRWDSDERFVGAGHARDAIPAVQRLLEAMQQDGWVAEDPEAHLLPHIAGAADRAPTVWRLEATDGSDPNRYVIDLEWRRRGGNHRDLIADVYVLIGRIAEAQTHITERKTPTTVEFDITTGMLAGDGQFAGHGHVIVLRIAGPGVEALLDAK